MSGSSCLVVMYHYVRDPRATAFPGIKALRPGDFDAQLDWLVEHFTVIGQETLEAAVLAGAPLPPRAALLTFDDGVVDHYTTVMPALRSRGLTGTFFIAGMASNHPPRLMNVHQTHFLLDRLGAEGLAGEVRARARARTAGEAERWAGIYRLENDADRATKRLLNYELPFADADRILDGLFREHIGDPDDFARAFYLTPRMVREMADAGMAFGFHTHSHRVLSRLDAAGQREELAGGVELVRALTGQQTVSFCFPYGRPQTYDAHTLRLLDDLGYSAAFNTVRRRAALPGDDRFELPRFDTNELPPFTAPPAAADGAPVPAVAP